MAWYVVTHRDKFTFRFTLSRDCRCCHFKNFRHVYLIIGQDRILLNSSFIVILRATLCNMHSLKSRQRILSRGLICLFRLEFCSSASRNQDDLHE